jgi:hypothetical protein
MTRERKSEGEWSMGKRNGKRWKRVRSEAECGRNHRVWLNLETNANS